jgi:hypothetical protein
VSSRSAITLPGKLDNRHPFTLLVTVLPLIVLIRGSLVLAQAKVERPAHVVYERRQQLIGQTVAHPVNLNLANMQTLVSSVSGHNLIMTPRRQVLLRQSRACRVLDEYLGRIPRGGKPGA